MSIDIINLSKKYGETLVLSNLNFKFRDGLKYVIKGENGVGKSTFLKAILNITKYEGIIDYDGDISYSPEVQYMPPFMKVKTFIKTFSELTERVEDLDNKLINYLAYFNLKEDIKDMYIGSLSKGQKQKISLINALISPSKMLLLDEPFSGLDSESKDRLVDLIIKDDRMIILISHEISCFDRKIFDILEIKNGKINVLSKTH